MLAVSSLNTISSLISKALSDDYISDEEYLLILLEFETFKRMKEDLREKSKMNLEKTGKIEFEANELLRRKKNWCSDLTSCQNRVQNRAQNHVQNRLQNCVQNHVRK